MLNPFGHEYTPKPLKAPDLKAKPSFIVETIEPKMVKDGTGDTVGHVTGKTDLAAQIEADRENCGLEYILKQVAAGSVLMDELDDDVDKNGDYGGDFTRPTMVSEASQVVNNDLNNIQRLDKIANELGVSREELLNCKDIKALVASKIAPQNEPDKEVK